MLPLFEHRFSRLALVALTPFILGATASRAQDEQIIGYAYGCEARMPMPAPSSALEGHLTVNEDGTKGEFFAQLYGVTLEMDPVGMSNDAKGLRRLGKSEHVRWSMVWREQGGNVPMSFGAGELRIEVSTPRKLKLKNILLVGRDDYTRAPMIAASRRWPGRTNGAEFGFGISELLGFAGNAPSLRWWLYSGTGPPEWTFDSRGRRASGSLDLSGPRSVAAAFERLRLELITRAADYRASCAKRPVYYDPAGEI